MAVGQGRSGHHGDNGSVPVSDRRIPDQCRSEVRIHGPEGEGLCHTYGGCSLERIPSQRRPHTVFALGRRYRNFDARGASEQAGIRHSDGDFSCRRPFRRGCLQAHGLRLQELGVSAQLRGRALERLARANGRIVEEHEERLAMEERGESGGEAISLHLPGQVQHRFQFPARPILGANQIALKKIHRAPPRGSL